MLRSFGAGHPSVRLQKYCTFIVLIQDVFNTFIPCSIMNNRVHKICPIISSTATNSPTIELRTLHFCLVDVTTGHPVPMVKTPPVWPLMSGCVANDASTCQCSTPVFKAPSTSGKSRVLFKYTTRCLSFRQSSSLGALTLVVRNATANTVSGLAHFVTYNIIAIMVFVVCGGRHGWGVF